MALGALLFHGYAFVIVVDIPCVAGAALAAEVGPAIAAEQLGGQQIIVLGLVTRRGLFILRQLLLHPVKEVLGDDGGNTVRHHNVPIGVLPDIAAVVQKVLEKESREKPPVIVVKKDGINYQLKCEDIRYLEAIPRGTRLHLVTENWDVPYVTLRQMLLKMPKGMFAQCHRMYAVNKNEVEYYDTVNRIIRIKNCPDTVEIGVTYKSLIGGLLNG